MAPTTRHLKDRRPSRPPNPETIRKRAAKAKTKNCRNPPQIRPPSPARRQPESESEEEDAEDEAYLEPAPANQIQPPANHVAHAAQRVQAPVVISIDDSDGETKKKKKHDPMFYQIKAKIQKKLWRVCKFVTCADDRMKVAQKVYQLLNFQNAPDNHEEEWLESRLSDVNKAVNDVRSYSVGEIKKKLQDYWTYNNHTLPPLDDLKACMNRTIDIKLPGKLDIMKFWVDEILDAACANKFDWCPHHRHYMTITDAANQPSKFNNYMNPSTEAWAMVCIENYYDNWLGHFEWKHKYPKKKIVTSKKKRILEEGEAPFPDPKWTDSHGGQTVYCGWHPDGLKKYNEYKETNTTARQGTRSYELEATILTNLKQDWGIVGETPDQGKPTKKRKKDEAEEKVNTLDF